MLGTLNKQIEALASRRRKQEKLVADLTAPVKELEELREQEAAAVATKAALDAEAAQLALEIADLTAPVQKLDQVITDLPTTLRCLENFEAFLLLGYAGDPRDVAAVTAMLNEAASFSLDLRARLARKTARIAELEGRS